jgi:hypothetical protein
MRKGRSVWLEYLRQIQEYQQIIVGILALGGVWKVLIPLLANKLRADYCEKREKEHIKQLAYTEEKLNEKIAEFQALSEKLSGK